MWSDKLVYDTLSPSTGEASKTSRQSNSYWSSMTWYSKLNFAYISQSQKLHPMWLSEARSSLLYVFLAMVSVHHLPFTGCVSCQGTKQVLVYRKQSHLCLFKEFSGTIDTAYNERKDQVSRSIFFSLHQSTQNWYLWIVRAKETCITSGKIHLPSKASCIFLDCGKICTAPTKTILSHLFQRILLVKL